MGRANHIRYKRLQLGLCGAVQCRCFRKIGPLRSASDDERPTKMWDSIVLSPFLVYYALVSNLVTMTNRQQKCVAHASKHMHKDADKTKGKSDNHKPTYETFTSFFAWRFHIPQIVSIPMLISLEYFRGWWRGSMFPWPLSVTRKISATTHCTDDMRACKIVEILELCPI